MNRHPRTTVVAGAILAASVAVTACSSSGSPSTSSTNTSSTGTGPISIWYSNNAQEITWGQQMVASWNSQHPDQKISAQQIPTGTSSEEVIGAAITAGTEPCLIFNTSPASVPQFQQQGGLVNLSQFPDASAYIQSRTGPLSGQYKSPDGNFYQLPWKSNPVMIFYNKTLFTKAGLDPNSPKLSTYSDFISTARQLVAKKVAKYAIYPSPTSQFYQSWFDFYPMYAAASGGQQLIADSKATFDDSAGQQVTDFWRTMYADHLAGKDAYNGDAFADGVAAMSIVGPWAISVYQGKVNWGEVPVPTPDGTSKDQIHTFSDAKNVAMYASCKNKQTAWNVLKFATSMDQDGKLLQMTGQMPMRTGLQQAFASYFTQNPAYIDFAAQAARTVEVPQLSESITIWQHFRDDWSKYVIFGGSGSTQQFITQTAADVNTLAGQSQ
jgi:multiple sugar transport system substrate-binding protein